MVMRRLRLCVLTFFFASAFAVAQDTWQKECAELAVVLQWRPGDIVADIGAGKGKLTAFTAERIGPSGRVYGTEIDPEKFTALQDLAGSHTNITAIKGSDSDTNLPDLSCDSIYMRLVYHHFTKPNDMDSSLFRSLKHKGRLAIIDEEPVKGTTIPEGVPKNRIGHGIPQKVLISELKHAGFKVQPIEKEWPGSDASHPMYCVVFLKR